MSQNNKMGNLFPRPYPSKTFSDVNKEGAPSFLRTPEEQLINSLMTGTFENTFYASGREVLDETIDLCKHFAGENPEFLARACVYARERGYMRLAPITALVVLSTAKDKRPFYKAFPRVISNPGDLQDFVTIVLSHRIRGWGKAVQNAVSSWLVTMSEYHAIKYGSEQQSVSLRDIYRMAHPKLPMDAARIADYLVHHKYDAKTRFAAYERLKISGEEKPSEDEICNIIRNAGLPWEVVTAHAPASAKVWQTLVHNLPPFALLRNLNTCERHGAFNDVETLQYVCSRLTDRDAIVKSRLFPFRYLTAIKEYGGGRREIMKALHQALEISVSNIPEMRGNVLIANDVSGSMQHSISDKSSVTCSDIASLFAAAIFKRAANSQIISFDGSVHPRNLSPDDSVATIAQAIAGNGGSTNLSAPIRHLAKLQRQVDIAVFLTDSESWVEAMRGRLDRNVLLDYRNRFSPNLQCYFIQLQPYKDAVVPPSDTWAHYIFGWSDAVLRFIAEGPTQVDMVAKYPLDKTAETV